MDNEIDQGLKRNYAGVWDGEVGFGRKAALLNIDVVSAYTVRDSPLYAAGAEKALPFIKNLIAFAREIKIPIIYTRVVFRKADCSDAGLWIVKAPVLKLMRDGGSLGAYCEGIEPRDDEIEISKQYASAFFGTSLVTTLRTLGVDTVILQGFSTSGCIRATAIDGLQWGFHVIVANEGVGDRHIGPHEANLFDINSKYGDVLAIENIKEKLAHAENAKNNEQ